MSRSLSLCGLGCAAALLCAPVIAWAAQADGGTASESVPPEVLVHQLGDDCFQTRQQASRALIGLGLAAQEAVQRASGSRDPEVRRRAKQVLTAIFEQDYRQRLSAFETDSSGKTDYHLPGWERFQQTFGSGASERKLFVAMHRNEPKLMTASGSGGEPAAAMLDVRCAELQELLNQGDGTAENDFTLGTAAAFYFIASDESVPISEIAASHLCNLFSYRPNVQKALQDGEFKTSMRRLMGAWVARDVNPFVSNQNFAMAMQYGLKEALEPALKILRQQGADVQVRQFALHVVARFGDKRHISVLDGLLGDTSACSSFEIKPGKTVEIQIRDVALGALLHLTSQSLAEYGFSGVQKNNQWVFIPGSLRFTDGGKREAALKKWAQWYAANPPAKT